MHKTKVVSNTVILYCMFSLVCVCVPHPSPNWSMLAAAPAPDPSPLQAQSPNAAASPTQMDLTAGRRACRARPSTNGWCITAGTSAHINPNKGLSPPGR